MRDRNEITRGFHYLGARRAARDSRELVGRARLLKNRSYLCATEGGGVVSDKSSRVPESAKGNEGTFSVEVSELASENMARDGD